MLSPPPPISQSSIQYSLGSLRLSPPHAKPVLTQQSQLAESNGNRQVGRKGLWKTRRLSEPNVVVVCDWDFPSLGGMNKPYIQSFSYDNQPLAMPTSPIYFSSFPASAIYAGASLGLRNARAGRMNTVGKVVPSLGRGIDGFSAWLRKGFSHGQLGVVHLSI